MPQPAKGSSGDGALDPRVQGQYPNHEAMVLALNATKGPQKTLEGWETDNARQPSPTLPTPPTPTTPPTLPSLQQPPPTPQHPPQTQNVSETRLAIEWSGANESTALGMLPRMIQATK